MTNKGINLIIILALALFVVGSIISYADCPLCDPGCDGEVADFELLGYIENCWLNESVTNQDLVETIDFWWYNTSSEGTQVTVVRDMPSTVIPEQTFNISLIVEVNESNKPNGIIMEEYVPAGWSFVSCSSNWFRNYNAETGRIRFLGYGRRAGIELIRDQTITYLVTASNVTGNVTISGTVEIRNKTANISGDTTVLVSIYTITANRTLPETAPAGSSVNVTITLDVNETGKPNSVIIKDYFPAGWDVTSSGPTANSLNSTKGEIKWILTGDEVVDRVVSYVIEIPSGEIGNRTFSGELIYNDPESNPVTVSIGGDSVMSIEGECPKGDADCNGTVSDFELLDYVDRWVQGLVDDFDLLEAIDNWAS